MHRRHLKLALAALVLIGVAGAASAQERKIEFCSAGKKAWRMAVAYDTAEGRLVEGWYAVPLSGCAGLTVPADKTLYYFGESTDDGRVWPPPGLSNTKYCVQSGKDKFSYVIRKSRIEDAHKATRCPGSSLGPSAFIFHFPTMPARIDLPY